jgi:ankyrin repeat protein
MDTIHSDNQAIKDNTSFVRKAISTLGTGVDVILQDQSHQQRDNILEWISSTDFPALQSDFIARRQDGTGLWFLDSPEFSKWIHGLNQTLFCPGIPGAGKTIMAATTIDHLLRTLQSDTIGVAYIYCNYKAKANQNTTSLLASILKQLVQARPSIAEPVTRLYNDLNQARPSLEEIHSALQSILTNYSSVYIVVDALDECQEKDGTRSQLLVKLRDLQRKADMRLMITSRFIPDIENEFRLALRLEVRANDADVKRFVMGQISRLPKCVQRDKELQRIVQDKIAGAVDGMLAFRTPFTRQSTYDYVRFLLTRLHVDSLLDKDTKKKVRSALEKLSKGSEVLDQAYGEAIERIEGQLPGNRARAKSVLSWITYALRPLTTGELCHALAVEGDKELDQDNIPDVEDVVSVCAGLVTIDKESNIIRLVHYTTQEYFERIREDWNPSAQQEIASTCLNYLCLDTFRSGSCLSDKDFESRVEQYVFLDYAALYWGRHVLRVQEEVSLLAFRLLRDSNLVSCAVQIMSASKTGSRFSPGYSEHFPAQTTGLHLTAEFGLLHLLEKLLHESGRDFMISADWKDGYGQTPLARAAANGHEAAVKLLLDKEGIDPDSKDYYGQTPLARAAANGHEGVVKLLLDKESVDPNSRDEDGQTPLWRAAEDGHEGVVKLLLDRNGVHPDPKDDYDQTPLWWAAVKGHEGVVKLLLDKEGVDPNSKDDYGQTPLWWATVNGHEGVVKLLLDKEGVDPNPKDEDGQTPLCRAAEDGHEGLVKLLLDKEGIDPNSKDDDSQTPLWWAAASGHEGVVKLLLDKEGVDLDSKDNNGLTPLWRAAEDGHEGVVKLLLDKEGIDPDPKDDYGQTPLWWAAAKGREGVVRLLLDKEGVDPDPKNREGWTPLTWAARNGHEAVVKLLLDKGGVYPDSRGRDGLTSLAWAARSGHEAVVKLLLGKEGVYPDSRGRDGLTSLAWAARNGHEAVVKLLLGKEGVDPDSRDRDGWTSLAWAAKNGHEAAVKLLLDKEGVDPDPRDRNGWTPLSWAAAIGHEAVVKLLLDKEGVDPDSKSINGWAPLTWVAGSGRKAVVKLLQSRGALSL